MFTFLGLIIIISLILIFFLSSWKEKWKNMNMSVFECGFSSYFFSRYSMSIHYFLIALTFLLLDLELCFLFPFFVEESSNMKINYFFFIFYFTLTLALVYEWSKSMFEWKN